MKRRIMSLLCVLDLVISSLPLTTFAQTASDYTAYLSDCRWSGGKFADALQSWAKPKRDINIEGLPIRMIDKDGKPVPCEKGLTLHADGWLTYNLNGKYTNFKSLVGTDYFNYEANAVTSLRCKVFVDDNLVWTSQDITCKTPYEEIDIDVSGAKTLKILAESTNEANVSDWSIWGNARLISKEPIESDLADFNIFVDGKKLEGSNFFNHEYWIYVNENLKSASTVSVTDNVGNPIEGVTVTQAGAIPDAAVISYYGMDFRVHFVPDGEWRTTSGEPYDGDAAGKPERPYMHDYSQTLTMKMFLAKPIDNDNSDVRMRFDQVLEQIKKIDKLSNGVPKIIYLVGWNHMGHDDRYPDWNVVNPYLCWPGSDDPVGDLRRLIREAKEYNTTVSLHLNTTDLYKDSNLWDDFLKNNLVSIKGGSLLQGGTWNGKTAYRANYMNMWETGYFKKQVDSLLKLLPELVDGGTIHSDVYVCYGNDQSTLDEEVEARRKMYRYWRDCGLDVTTEFINSYNAGDSEESNDTMQSISSGQVGLQPLAWHLIQSDEEWFSRPASLLTGGGKCEDSNYWGSRAFKDYNAFLYGYNMQGEPFLTKQGVLGEPAGWDKQFIEEFSLYTVPYLYQNQFKNVSYSDENNIKTLEKEGKLIARFNSSNKMDCTIQKNDVLLRQNTDVFFPMTWNDSLEMYAYSKAGYSNKTWTMLAEWSNVKSVDIYKVSTTGLTCIKAEQEVLDNKISLTLEANQAVIIKPHQKGVIPPEDKEKLEESKKELKALIEKAGNMDTTNCRPAAIAALKDAILSGQALLDNEASSQKEVDNAIATLLQVMVNLKHIVDRSALSELISILESIDKDLYTEESFKILIRALESARLMNDDAEEKEVRKAYEVLQDAVLQLTFKPVVDNIENKNNPKDKQIDENDNKAHKDKVKVQPKLTTPATGDHGRVIPLVLIMACGLIIIITRKKCVGKEETE